MPEDVPRTHPLILRLVAEGRWPGEASVSEERFRRMAPEESELFLQRPPFATVRDLSASNPFWTLPSSDPEGLDFDRAVLIGDFGLGSDAPIVLDHRLSLEAPRVLRLRWATTGEENRWVEMAPSVEAFVEGLGIQAVEPRNDEPLLLADLVDVVRAGDLGTAPGTHQR